MATGPSERTWVTVTWEQLDQKPIHLRNQLLTSSAKLVLEANEQRLAERLKKAHKGKKSRAQPAAGGASGSSGTCSHCRVFRAPASELAEHELGCALHMFSLPLPSRRLARRRPLAARRCTRRDCARSRTSPRSAARRTTPAVLPCLSSPGASALLPPPQVLRL